MSRSASMAPIGRMRKRVGSIFVSVLLAASPLASTAEEEPELAWQPSLSASFGIYSQSLEGNTTTSTVAVPSGTGDSLISEYFQLGTRLDTPLQWDVPSKPRLFLTAAVQIPLAEDLVANKVDESFDAIFNNGQQIDPDFAANCPDQIGNVRATTCSISVRNKATLNAMWTMGLGLDFTLPLDQNQFHIAPAFEYYGLAMQSKGEFSRTTSASGAPDLVETVDVTGNSDFYHGISPSLTASVDVYESGPLRFSMFLEGRVVWILTDQDLNASAQRGGTGFFFVVEPDDFIAQGGGGVRVQWTGKK